jgi:hypothetical protein
LTGPTGVGGRDLEALDQRKRRGRRERHGRDMARPLTCVGKAEPAATPADGGVPVVAGGRLAQTARVDGDHRRYRVRVLG